MPTIELPDRSFRPMINWYEISTRKSMEEKLPDPPNGQLLDEKIKPFISAVNSQGDVITLSDTLFCYHVMIILKTRKIKRVELPKLTHYPVALAVDINNNVYAMRTRLGERFMLKFISVLASYFMTYISENFLIYNVMICNALIML